MNAFETWLLTTLKGDLIASGGAPLATLLTNLQAHAGNAVEQAADLLAFRGAAPAAGITFTIEFEQQLLGLAITKGTRPLWQAKGRGRRRRRLWFPASMGKELAWSLVQGKGLLSRGIGWFGAGWYSHIDVVTPQGMLRGARSDVWGDVPAGYEDRPWAYGRATWHTWTLFTTAVSDDEYELYWRFSDAQLHKPYDTRGLINTFVFGRPWRDDDKWWCLWSEVGANGEGRRRGCGKVDSEIKNVEMGDCAFLFAGRRARRQQMLQADPVAC